MQLSPDQIDSGSIGQAPAAVDISKVLDFAVPSLPRQMGDAPSALYNTADGKAPNGNNGLGLRSDCQPAANCQAGQLTTAYNTTQFIAAEDFVPASSGFISTACLQGIFWNGTSDPSNLDGWCSDFGTEDWTLTYYEDTVGDGIPDTALGNVTFCTGVGCTGTAMPSGSGWSSDANVTNATKDNPTGNPDFAGIPIERITVEHAGLGLDGVGGSVPLAAGECYFMEWAVINGDTTSGAFGCAFFHQAGVPGNGRAMQDAAFDGYDCCESLSEDLTLCIDLALDNANIAFCDTCSEIPPQNEDCANAFFIGTLPHSESVDTAGASGGNADLPEVPGLEGFDMSDTEGVFYSVIGTGNQIQIDWASGNMDTVVGVYCGVCDGHYFGIGGDDDTGGGVNGTDAQYVLESELGTEYIIYLTSNFKCGQGDLTLTDLAIASTVPAEQCSTCTLDDYGTATIDEASGLGMFDKTGAPQEYDSGGGVMVQGEPCDDSGNIRVNDGCNATGIVSDFTWLNDGDVVSGNSWQFAGTRDTDWYGFNVADAGGAIVTWQATAQHNTNIFLIDIGGDIAHADCANLSIPATGSALRCATATVSAVVPQGDYVAWIGGQEFDFVACADGNTSYNAFLSVASCTIADPGE
ncbi:MAG: hypothetical protein DRJ50_12910, partial [Actinobacteria bacterium]